MRKTEEDKYKEKKIINQKREIKKEIRQKNNTQEIRSQNKNKR